MIQSDGFLDRLLGPLLKTGLPSMKNVIKSLAKSVLIPSRLTAAASAADEKILGSATTTLIISNDEMEDIMKTVRYFEDSHLCSKGIIETIQNEVEEGKGGFLSTLLGALGASLLENLLTDKDTIRSGEGTITAGYGSKRSLIKDLNFEIQKYYQNNTKFNGVYSRDNLHDKIKDGTYVIILDEYSDNRAHWIALNILNNNVTYFDGFGVERISKEIKIFSGNKSIQAKVLRIQAYDSVICGYFCAGFIDFMLKSKSFADFTNLFSSNDFKKNGDIKLNYFKTDLKFQV